MAYVIEMPPVVMHEIRDYEKATGRSLEPCIVEFVRQELHRRRLSDDWESRFDALVEKSAARLQGTPAYKFNRADAYPVGEFASANALGCDCLLTEDLNDGQIYCGVKAVNPFK